MKLLFCPMCSCVKSLRSIEVVSCYCGESWGSYTPDLRAEIGGEAIPLYIENSSLREAIAVRPERGIGAGFEAMVLPVLSPAVVAMD